MFPFGGDLLGIYLQDHLAGATAGLELARRARANNDGTELGEFLARLVQELADERESLRAMMGEVGVDADRLKVAAAWAAEKAGRLKLNGRILEYSPLSRVVELEGLITGVNGKLAMWRALRDLADQDSRFDPLELDRLIAQAQDQENGLREHHRLVAVDALTR